jgi:hypothetical protein
LLREHPELPQSAWLMAEQLELTADVESTAPDGANASVALRRRAAVLEGLRATPFSDHAASPELEAPQLRALNAEGPEPGDSLEWDGMRSGPTFTTATGEHHVRVSRSGRLLWAGWVTVAANAARIRLPVPEIPACSLDDIGAGHFEGDHVVAAPAARCASYVLARARAGVGIEAALCEREVCGKVVVFKYRAPTAAADYGWPRWATYTAVAAGVVATGLVLWRAGAFDRPQPGTMTVVTYMGQAKPMGFRF